MINPETFLFHSFAYSSTNTEQSHFHARFPVYTFKTMAENNAKQNNTTKKRALNRKLKINPTFAYSRKANISKQVLHVDIFFPFPSNGPAINQRVKTKLNMTPWGIWDMLGL